MRRIGLVLALLVLAAAPFPANGLPAVLYDVCDPVTHVGRCFLYQDGMIYAMRYQDVPLRRVYNNAFDEGHDLVLGMVRLGGPTRTEDLPAFVPDPDDTVVRSDTCDATTHIGVCTVEYGNGAIEAIRYRDVPRAYERPGGLAVHGYDNCFDPGHDEVLEVVLLRGGWSG